MADGDKQRKLTLLTEVEKTSLTRSKQAFKELHGDTLQLIESQKTLQRVMVRGSETVIRAAQQEATVRHRVSKETLDAARAEVAAQERVAEAYKRAARAKLPGGTASAAAGSAPGVRPLAAISAGSSALAGLDSVAGAGPAGDVLRTVSATTRLTQSIAQISGVSLEAEAGLGSLLATLGPIALVAGAVSAGFLLIKKSIDDANAAEQRYLDAENARIENRVRLTSEEARQKLKEMEQDRQILSEKRRIAQEAYDAKLKEVEAQQGTRGDPAFLVKLTGAQGLGALKKQVEETTAAAEQSTQAQKELKEDLSKGAFAANDAAEAQKKLAEATKLAAAAQARALQGAAIDGQLEYFQLIATGTRKSISEELEKLKVQEQVYRQEIQYLKGILATLSGPEAEAAKAKLDGVEQQLTKTSAEIDAHKRALASSQVALNSAKEAEEERTKAIESGTEVLSKSQQIANNYQKYLDDRKKAEADLAKQMADLEQRRIKILEDAEEARRQIQLDAKRDQEKAARQLAFNIVRTLVRATLDQFESLLTLDFAGAARSRRETAFNIQEQRAQFALDSQERQIAVQQRFEDQRVQIAEQLAEIEKERSKIQMEGVKAMADLFRALIAAQLQQIQQSSTSAPGFSKSGVSMLAGGGFLPAGQLAMVQEGFKGQSESFNGQRLPGGRGLFFPLQSGNVTNNSSPSVVFQPGAVVINESRDPRLTQKALERAIDTRIGKVTR